MLSLGLSCKKAKGLVCLVCSLGGGGEFTGDPTSLACDNMNVRFSLHACSGLQVTKPMGET